MTGRRLRAADSEVFVASTRGGELWAALQNASKRILTQINGAKLEDGEVMRIVMRADVDSLARIARESDG